MTPAVIYQSTDKVIYDFPLLAYQANLADPFTTIGDGIKNLIPWPIPSANYQLICPPIQNAFSYKYEMHTSITAKLLPTNAAGDYYPIPIKLSAYGNVPLGSFPWKINGQPIQNPFLHKKDKKTWFEDIQTIDLPTIDLELATNLSNLISTAVFTPDPTKTDWTLRVYLLISVIALKK